MEYINDILEDENQINELIYNAHTLINVVTEAAKGKGKFRETCLKYELDPMRTRRLLSALLHIKKESNVQDLSDAFACDELDGYERLYHLILHIPEDEVKHGKYRYPSDYEDSVNAVLDTLPEEKKDIVRKHFGVSGYSQQTLEELGEEYNISRERVRQIEATAIRSLRTSKNQKILLYGLRLYDKIQLEEEKIALDYEKIKAANLAEMTKEIESLFDMPVDSQLKSVSIDTLGLSVRSQNALQNAQIYTIYDLLHTQQLEKVRNLGARSQEEVMEKLNAYLAPFGLSREVYRVIYCRKENQENNL